ncbi:MAG: hypothetical protein HY270_11410 [Deltaproteobacteria bacterium]|nr:hypothetical protein [Deltaproteobacteria bacterium]
MEQFPMIAVALGLVGTPLWLMALVAFEKYRGLQEPSLVFCPETNARVAVALRNTMDAAAGSEAGVESCSRWPERQGCDQACLNSCDS